MVFPQHYTSLCTRSASIVIDKLIFGRKDILFFFPFNQTKKKQVVHRSVKGGSPLQIECTLEEGCALTQVILSCTCLHSWDEAKITSYSTVRVWTRRTAFGPALHLSPCWTRIPRQMTQGEHSWWGKQEKRNAFKVKKELEKYFPLRAIHKRIFVENECISSTNFTGLLDN